MALTSKDISSVFTPGSPIRDRDLFKGRAEQIHRVLATVPSPGRHPIIYGQRGVGKTSLVNILNSLLPNHYTVQITCDGSDSFKSIWNRILQKATMSFKEHAFGFNRETAEEKVNLSDYLGKDNGAKPSEIADILALIQAPVIFSLDEFDQISDTVVKSATASLIKNVSDNNANVTLILVGVAKSVRDLIGEHPSVQRNLVQIEMPIMRPAEIQQIITTGCGSLGLSVQPDVLEPIVFLAGGFPYYAHLLGLSICTACLVRDATVIDRSLFDEYACSFALEEASETYRQLFIRATKTQRPSRYPQILCACGLATADDDGVFRARDVVAAMQSTFAASLSLQAVVPALQAFTTDERGPILDRVPFGSSTHYAFREPMMRPFLRMKAKLI